MSRIQDTLRAIYYRFWKKPNVIRVQTLPSNDHVDSDELLSHSMFAVLERFLKDQSGEKLWGEEDRHILSEMIEMHDWWKGRYLVDKKQIWNNWRSLNDKGNAGHKFFEYIMRQDQILQDELKLNMARLVELSPYMWS